ncbi:helix-turn-helix domain-containing protein [Sporanaerobacter acetigenes]|uniref:helix-turn-helix domain-containing protein n=1 Tax=Sporanaerobacter acetigenes TaxID=165813 RepID=UPI0010492C30|nr:helix-turn-helix transcriptional regulator [Sporanaerobacter acetigenes]
MDFNLISFGEALRNIRGELALTLDDVSELSGINSETIRRIELGKVIPKFETLELLSLAYKQDLNAMFLKYRIDDCSYFYEIKNSNNQMYPKLCHNLAGVYRRNKNFEKALKFSKFGITITIILEI